VRNYLVQHAHVVGKARELIPDERQTRHASSSDATYELRAGVQRFVRSFGLLAGDQTPCGQPLAPSHAHALMLLLEAARAQESMSQQALAAALGLDKSSTARLCAKMEQAGHVDQQRAPADGRLRLIRLTSKGQHLAERVDAASRARFQQVLDAIPSSRARESVIAALRQLNQAIALVGRKEPNA
jgi:DNA-binding MarR family transcriptional regulator